MDVGNVTIHVVPMVKYLGGAQSVLDYLLPEIPAVYVWTIDLHRLRDLSPDRAPCQLGMLIASSRRTFTDRIGPYYQASLQDSPRPLSSNKESKLESIMLAERQAASWILLSATIFQRPLYVGQASNLRQRIRQHVDAGSRLRSYLTEAGLTIDECCLTYLQLPESFAALSATDEDEESEGELASPMLDVLESVLLRTSRKPLI